MIFAKMNFRAICPAMERAVVIQGCRMRESSRMNGHGIVIPMSGPTSAAQSELETLETLLERHATLGNKH